MILLSNIPPSLPDAMVWTHSELASHRMILEQSVQTYGFQTFVLRMKTGIQLLTCASLVKISNLNEYEQNCKHVQSSKRLTGIVTQSNELWPNDTTNRCV
jgi:hypothetical protein